MGPVLLLMAIVTVICFAIVGVGRAWGAGKTTRARTQFGPMSVAELESAVPPVQVALSLTSKTIFGTERAAWFEALLQRTSRTPSESARGHALLVREWLRNLHELRSYLTGSVPTAWGPEADVTKPVVLVVGKPDAWFVAALRRTLEWLRDVAARQQALARSDGASVSQWNAGLFQCETGMETTGVLFQTRYRYWLRTPCNLALLDAEIRRLESGEGGEPPAVVAASGSAGPASATPSSAAAVSAAPSPAPPRRQFLSSWVIWSFLPWLNWIAWLHASIRARRLLYVVLAVLYAIPLGLALATAGAPGTKMPNWVGSVGAAAWMGGVVHVLLMRKRVNARIETAARERQGR